MVTPLGKKELPGESDNARNNARCTQARNTHAQPGWTTSRRGQDSLWKSQSKWQSTEINGESTFTVWPTIGSRTAKAQNRIVSHFSHHGLATRMTDNVPLRLFGHAACCGDARRSVRWERTFTELGASRQSRTVVVRREQWTSKYRSDDWCRPGRLSLTQIVRGAPAVSSLILA